MRYFVRSAGYDGYRALVRELGGDPEACLRAAGVEPDALDKPDDRTSYRRHLEALNNAAEATNTPHFGLLLSRKQSFSMLGAIGFAMMEAPTVRDAIENLHRYLHLHLTGARTTLNEGLNVASWTFEVLISNPPPIVQGLDLVAGIGVNMIRQLVGHSWSPSSVNFPHSRPADDRPYRQFFRTQILFDQELGAINFDRRILDRQITNANQQLFEILNAYLKQQQQHVPTDFLSLVRETIVCALHEGNCSVQDTGRRLGLSPRTLQRRLNAQGSSFKKLLAEVRNNIAQQYLRNTTVPLTRIAVLLGYSELAAFSRSFRREFGLSPTDWREKQQHGAGHQAKR
jgi:AraC-like DNA-binding protein